MASTPNNRRSVTQEDTEIKYFKVYEENEEVRSINWSNRGKNFEDTLALVKQESFERREQVIPDATDSTETTESVPSTSQSSQPSSDGPCYSPASPYVNFSPSSPPNALSFEGDNSSSHSSRSSITSEKSENSNRSTSPKEFRHNKNSPNKVDESQLSDGIEIYRDPPPTPRISSDTEHRSPVESVHEESQTSSKRSRSPHNDIAEYKTSPHSVAPPNKRRKCVATESRPLVKEPVSKPSRPVSRPNSESGQSKDSRENRPASRESRPASRENRPESRQSRPDSRQSRAESRSNNPDSRQGRPFVTEYRSMPREDMQSRISIYLPNKPKETLRRTTLIEIKITEADEPNSITTTVDASVDPRSPQNNGSNSTTFVDLSSPQNNGSNSSPSVEICSNN